MYKEAKEFAEKYVKPYNLDIDKEGTFPSEILDKIGEEGYFSLVIPREYGGSGKGLKEVIEVIHALSEASPSVGLVYTMHPAAVVALYENDNTELAKHISEEIVKNNYFMTGAHSEFETGCHCISTMNTESKEHSMTYTGRKSMITAGGYAKYYLTTTPPTIEEAQDYWMFDKDMPGISFEENKWDGVGMRGNMAVPMIFDHVEVDSKYRVGTQALNSTIYFNLGLAAVYSAITQRAYEESLEHVKSRKYSDGSSLFDFDAVKKHISRIYRLSYSSKASIEKVIDTFEKDPANALKECLAARILASENSVEATTIAMRIGGGQSYNKSNIIESLHRDALASQVMTPSLDVLEQLVSSML